MPAGEDSPFRRSASASDDRRAGRSRTAATGGPRRGRPQLHVQRRHLRAAPSAGDASSTSAGVGTRSSGRASGPARWRGAGSAAPPSGDQPRSGPDEHLLGDGAAGPSAKTRRSDRVVGRSGRLSASPAPGPLDHRRAGTRAPPRRRPSRARRPARCCSRQPASPRPANGRYRAQHPSSDGCGTAWTARGRCHPGRHARADRAASHRRRAPPPMGTPATMRWLFRRVFLVNVVLLGSSALLVFSPVTVSRRSSPPSSPSSRSAC